MNWIMSWWYRRQRAIDMQILWPSCKEYAATLDDAKAAFAVHAYNDPAWTILGERGIFEAINGLQ